MLHLKETLTRLMVCALLFSPPLSAGELWDKTKSVAKGAVDTAGKVAGTVGDAVKEDKRTPEQVRADIDKRAEGALQRLLKASPKAKQQYDKAAGYAVFDTRKFSILITTGFGAGVSVDKKGDQRIYMKMATGGLNLGAGAKFYQVIFLFPDQKSQNDFVEQGWNAGSEASAVGGKEGGELGVRLKNGTIVHQLTDTGLALSIDLTGTRYWKDDKLNQ